MPPNMSATISMPPSLARVSSRRLWTVGSLPNSQPRACFGLAYRCFGRTRSRFCFP